MVAEYPKPAQVKKRGKPDLAAAAKELAASEAAAPTVMDEAKQRIKQKRTLRDAGVPVDVSNRVGVQELPIEAISEGNNPRKIASSTEQKRLGESIKEHGVIVPIRVRPLEAGRFEIIAGHRRFKAAKSAHLKTIPAVVAIATDQDALVQSLVENIVREDLNPLDEAKAIKFLLEVSGMTQEAVGKRLGRTQSAISKSVGLLNLDPVVQEALEAGQISPTHGVSLATLEPERQREFAKAAVEGGYSTKELDEKVGRLKDEQRNARQHAEQIAAARATALESIEKFVAGRRGLSKKNLVVVLSPYGRDAELAPALTEAGFTVNTTEGHERPKYECACTKVTFAYDAWRGMSPVCLDDEHYRAWKKAADRERQKAAAEAGKSVDRNRNALAKALRADEGKGVLNIDGQRFALYLLLGETGGYYSSGASSRGEAFVKRHLGTKEGRIVRADVLEAVMGLSDKDLGEELARLIVGEVIVNVWGDDVRYGWDQHWYARQVAVEQFGLETGVVYGNAQPTGQQLEAMAARGVKLSKAETKTVKDRQSLAERRQISAVIVDDEVHGEVKVAETTHVDLVEGADGPEEADVTE